jgi:hypothetical protein
MSEATYEFGAPPSAVPATAPLPAAPPLTAAPVPSLLDGLLAELEQDATQETVTLGVQSRPGWEVRYAIDIPYEQLAQWRAAAADPAMPGGMNELQVACSALAACCRAILVGGEDVTDVNGPVTFASPDLQRRLGVTRPVDAVRKLYRFDGHVTASGTRLLQAAGYGQGANPTQR